MMGIFGRFRGKTAQPEPAKLTKDAVRWINQRAFEAAEESRLFGNWGAGNASINEDLRNSLKKLRDRSRSLCQNEDYPKKFLEMCKTNVVGSNGFTLQVRSFDYGRGGQKVMDSFANAALEKAFSDWARVGNCDVTGRLSFFDICRMYISCLVRDGEVLIRKVRGGAAQNKYGFALQVLDIERLDVDLNIRRNGGNQIRMGIEIDQYNRPVNYHLLVANPQDGHWQDYSSGKKYEVVPADQIYHHFMCDTPEQLRGYPWMHTAMRRLWQLGKYDEAAVVAARAGASQMFFYKPPMDADGMAMADGQSERGELYKDMEAGGIGILPAGWGIEKFDPNYPAAQYPAFNKAVLRGISSGLNVSYNSLSSDLEGVNFSSIRAGVLDERDHWMAIQGWMIEHFLAPLYTEWLRWALLNKAVVQYNGSALPIAKFDKFDSAQWQGRRWQWVDPVADTQANIMAIEKGLKSRTDVVAELGGDFDDVVMKLKEEQDKIAELGIILAPPAGVAQQGVDQSNNGGKDGKQNTGN